MMMVFVKKQWVENGKNIVLLDSENTLITSILDNSIKFAKQQTDASEFRIVINGHELKFTQDTEYYELVAMYRDMIEGRIRVELKKGERLTPEMYHDLEYKDNPLERNWMWTTEEQIKDLDTLMDVALLNQDIEWVKKIHSRKKELQMEIHSSHNEEESK